MLGGGFVVAGVVDLAEDHHGVIFVKDVVAVKGKLAGEITEAKMHDRGDVVFQTQNIFPTLLDDSGILRRLAVDAQRLKRLEMHVKRMLPSRLDVLKYPLLD